MKCLGYIWSYHRWLIKLVLFVFFWLIIGLPQAMVQGWKESRKNQMPIEERALAEKEMTIFSKNLLAKAESKISSGIAYSPYDYFDDLKAHQIRCHELKLQGSTSPEIQRLNYMMRRAVEDKKFSERDIDKAVEGYRNFIDPARQSREDLRKSLDENGWMPVLIWLFWLYLKVLPLASILYVVWIKDEQDCGEFKLPKPFSFFGLLLIYPLIIGGRWWRLIDEKERWVRAEAEMRRSLGLFTYLSDEEQARIKQFAKSNLSIDEWKRELSELDLQPRHSFAAALTVTLIFVFCLRPIEASASKFKSFDQGSEVLTQIGSVKNLARSQIDSAKYERSQVTDKQFGFDAGLPDFWVCEAIGCIGPWPDWVNLAIDPIVMRSYYFRKIDHIPIMAICFGCQNQLITQF